MSYTQKALNLLRRLRLDMKKFVVYEIRSHDGYDENGPKSDLWDLYLTDIETSSVRIYHRENWWGGGDMEEYVLVRETTANKNEFR